MCTKLVYLIFLQGVADHAHPQLCGAAWLMVQLTNGQHTCELVFKSKADILNIRCDYQFVFSVLDERYAPHHA